MGIMLNFEKDIFEKYYYIWGYIIILENLGNSKCYLKLLKFDLFIKFYDVLDHGVITKSYG